MCNSFGPQGSRTFIFCFEVLLQQTQNFRCFLPRCILNANTSCLKLADNNKIVWSLISGQELRWFLFFIHLLIMVHMFAKFFSHTILYNYLSMKNRKRFYTYHEILSIASCSMQWYDDKLLPTTFQPHKWNNRGAPLSERTIECGLSFFTIDIFFIKAAKPFISFTKIRK